FPTFKTYSDAIREIFDENLLESFGQPSVVGADVALFMKSERSIVEICSSYGDPRAIDNHRLLVQHRPVVFVDLDARLQQFSIQMNSAIACERHIVVNSRKHQLDVNAAFTSADQDVDARFVGYEIRIRDVK